MEKNQKLEIWAIIGSNFAIAALVVALFTWNRTESNNDRRDMMAMIRSIETEAHANIQAITQEMKDFHGRLCTIEERKK